MIASARASRALTWMARSWVVWTLVLVLDVASYFLGRVMAPVWTGPILAKFAILIRVGTWYSWWLWTPVIFYLAGRFRFEAGTRLRSVAVHTVAALVIIQCNNALGAAIRASMDLVAVFPPISMSSLVQYAAVCGVAMILRLRGRERAHLLSVSRIESQLTQSRRQALTAQLRPHFLYNALNGVAMLIRSGAHAQALEAVLGYGELLRKTIDADLSEVPLRDELAFLDRYLAIERMRFSETLAATIVSEPGTGDALVPNLVLQPLVENALHHGLSNLEQAARLDIIATRSVGGLRLEVRDNGAGLPPNWRLDTGAGIGLRSTRTRLRECYGERHHFELRSRLEGGTSVIIEIPYRTAAAAGAS